MNSWGYSGYDVDHQTFIENMRLYNGYNEMKYVYNQFNMTLAFGYHAGIIRYNHGILKT